MKVVYIDESGDESVAIELPNISKFYVVCAVVIEPELLAETTQRFQEVKNRYFKQREMKSEGLHDLVRRSVILQELLGAKFSIHVLVGDKSLLNHSGFRYPKTFIKYLHGKLYREILRDHQVSIRADKIKNPAFMSEMKSYLDRNGLFTLFNEGAFDFVDSRNDVCIQATDFICGSIRYCFERNHHTAMNDPLLKQLDWHIAQFVPFPEGYHRYVSKLPGVGDHDQSIESRAVAEAEQFIRLHSGSDDIDRQLQVALVSRLLREFVRSDPQWVSTEELIGDLNCIAPDPISEQSFRGVVGQLRDDGLLIASRTSWGYKLPTSMNDVTEFLNRQNSQLGPMLERIRTARTIVRRATDNCVDILAGPGFENLKAIVDSTPLIVASHVAPYDQNLIGTPPQSVPLPGTSYSEGAKEAEQISASSATVPGR